jgi:hypothetical protein
MSNDEFDSPGSVTGVEWAELNGRLLLIQPHSSEEIDTVHGRSKAVRADIVVLDGPGAPEEIIDTLIFPKVVSGQVRGNVGTGRRNLGRLGQGNKKPGQTAPWILADPTDADKAVARAYLSSQTVAPF